MATRRGGPIEALVAVTGVAGGAPPAMVDMVYCCPKAQEPLRSSRLKACLLKNSRKTDRARGSADIGFLHGTAPRDAAFALVKFTR